MLYGWLSKRWFLSSAVFPHLQGGLLYTEDKNSTFQFQLFLVRTTLETGNSKRHPNIKSEQLLYILVFKLAKSKSRCIYQQSISHAASTPNQTPIPLSFCL